MWSKKHIRDQTFIYSIWEKLSDSHLWSAGVLSVIEIIVIGAEKGVQGQSIKIPQTQCLEVIYLLHKT